MRITITYGIQYGELKISVINIKKSLFKYLYTNIIKIFVFTLSTKKVNELTVYLLFFHFQKYVIYIYYFYILT